MKKFGFGKKKDDGGDPGRGDLNGDKRSKGGANNGGNPYATVASAHDPYMNNAGPPAYTESRGGATDRFRTDKSPAYAGGYGGNEPPTRNRFGGGAGGPPSDRNGGPPGGDRYGPGNYGNTGGFGQSPYGDSVPAQPAGSRYGTGGYGGFGGANPSA
jgi:protein transport protein SEC9